MNISQRIFAILKNKHLSQRDLAEYAGLSPAAVSSWKSRHTSPSADKLVKISEFLGVSPYFLLTGMDDPCSGPLTVMDSAGSYESAFSNAEWELLTLFRQLSDLEQGRILGIVQETLQRTLEL